MKYLLVLALVLVIFWVWRSSRTRSSTGHDQTRKPDGQAVKTEIVECDVCHLHLPRSDALIGTDGTFCSHAHRVQAGRKG